MAAKKRKGRRSARGGGSIFYAASKGVWVWRAVVGTKPGGGVRHKEGRAKTQAGALAAKKEAETTNTAAGETTRLSEWIGTWLDRAKSGVRRNTFRRYRGVADHHIIPALGGYQLGELQTKTVSRFFDGLSRAGLSPRTIRKVAVVLGASLNAAVEDGVLTHNPAKAASRPKPLDDASVEVFQADESRRILEAVRGTRFEVAFVIAEATGARRSEVLALERADFDVAAGTMTVSKMADVRTVKDVVIQPPKSKNGRRTIKLPGYAMASLRPFLAKAPPTGPVFTSRTGGYCAANHFSNTLWHQVLKKAGVRYRKLHVLRHTVVSRLLAAGVPVTEVARYIGDSVQVVTSTYSHWLKPSTAASDALDAYHNSQGGVKVA